MSAALITGATGFLGRETVGRLLARDTETRLVALIRARDEPALACRLASVRDGLRHADAERLTAVRGDMTQARLGLEARAYDALVDRVDRVIHVAATTSFRLPLDAARRRNVGGTAEALAFCRALRARGKSGRLDYVSTAYVAGDRADLVLEAELDAGQGFRNTYERSKFEAERLCRTAADDLPVAIYRPSIIVGHSRTGSTTSFKAFYVPMKLLVCFYLRCRPLTNLVPLPLRRDCPLDIVPVDYVAEAVATLYGRAEAVGCCYHLAAGPEDAVSIEAAVQLGCDFFGVPPRRYADPAGRAAWIARAVRPLARRLWPSLAQQVEQYLPYTRTNPLFDTGNSRAAGLVPPHFATYFPRILGYALGTGFGRTVLEASREEQPRQSVAQAVAMQAEA